MRNYIVELTLTGTMTQVPDSQKLFGALVYLFAERYGAESASGLVKAIRNREIHLALSNVIPAGYLPVPQGFLTDRISEAGGNGIDLKKKRADIKARSYIKQESLNRVLAEPEKCGSVYPYVKQQDLQQLRASVDSIRYDIPELDTRLYSVPTVALTEISREKDGPEHSRFVKHYCFYLQTDESGLCSEVLSMLDAAVTGTQEIILGKRASQGLNLFRIDALTEQAGMKVEKGIYLNTGMLLPDRINFKSSSIRLFTSERRPFEMTGGWNGNAPKYYISFIAQGSIIFAPEGAEYAGKSIESPFRRNRDIVFGNAFLYPIDLKKGQV